MIPLLTAHYFVGFPCDRFFAAVNLMMSVPFPFDGKGAVDLSTAAAINASTSGCANWLAASTGTKRAWLPDPCSSRFGSGN